MLLDLNDRTNNTLIGVVENYAERDLDKKLSPIRPELNCI